ncbi:repressor [Serratia fonticola]|uniref:Helix-turn-helix domain-containing protein n=1 Tax=Serratia fonticola TaxID=47917 RepID=A0AAE7EFF3_SERFO|nr:phage repressor protein CI [Serratia fonticola]OIX91522.1 repressor [Serratia fonticola]QCR63220.1 phage repressor protein [Serratia fonticola]QKJ57608.1 helix-turn-helix domain-containing protein [Serratia fonticola]
MLSVNFESGGGEVLDRIIEAHGFTSKIDYCNHLNISASSLSMRYKRQLFPSDLAIRCIAETGVNLEWLVTGQGKKFDTEELDILKLDRRKLVDGQLYDSGYAVIDKLFFREGSALPSKPFCVLDDKVQYIVDQRFTEVYDGEWLVNIEGKVSIRTLTRIPVKKVRVSGASMSFECSLEDIQVIGSVVLVITKGN